MLGQFKTRRPPKNFNLLYLETNQVYFMTIKANLLIKSTHQQAQGKIHLCSRSIFFQHCNIAKPMIRIKFSCGAFLRMLKNIDMKKAHKLVNMKKSENQMKNILSKGPNFISEILEKEENSSQIKNKNQSEGFLTKIYQPLKKKKSDSDQKIGNCFFIKCSKILIIYRKPISPYITQKIDQNFVFQLNKSTPKNKIFRFLKIYDEITKCLDQEKLIQSIVNATTEQSAEELLEVYQDQKLDALSILRCKRVKIEGSEYGQMILLKSKVKYYSLINNPEMENIEFTYLQIKFMTKYRYLFEEKGIQVWLYNHPYSILFVFNDNQTRQVVYRHLKQRAEKMVSIDAGEISKLWSEGSISNIQYINYLNALANRSHNDLSQYPVFPWIFHTYDGDFDIRNQDIYRDLTKPIGAINKHRLRKLKDLYEIQTKDKTITHPPHLYPTHYSTPGYVSYFLIRKIPEFIVKLQNGVFSPSDRIFRCVQSAYYSSMNGAADFKELIPEFYSSDCDFLVNSQKLEMGTTPEGQVIDDVLLPKWATNAEDFLIKSRAAFQSDFVSAHLHDWVDLIFGYKQSGTSAITSDNIYYWLTYQQNVNFDRPMSRMERAALEVQISQFGQTPVQLFEKKHSSKRIRLIHLDEGVNIQDKKLISGKIVALTEQNERLQQKIQRQRYRYNKKLNEKQQIIIKNNKEKKREVDKLKETLCIDQQSLKKFNFREKFDSEADKDRYIRQIEEMIRERERQNAEMHVIIAGMKRQVNDDNHSVHSKVDEELEDGINFFEDD